MTRKSLSLLGIVLWTGLAAAQVRWLGQGDRTLQTDGRVTEYSLPSPGSGPTTIALASDGTLWFTEAAGNRIGRMAQDGTGQKEFPLPNPGSAPRIIALGADGNMWFSEFNASKIGRTTPAGTIVEFDLPRSNSGPGDIAEFPLPAPNAGATGLTAGGDRQPPARLSNRLWFAESGANSIGYLEFR